MNRRIHGAVPFAVLIAILAAVLVFGGEYSVTLANYIGLSALVALGLVLLTGIGGMTSFGQAAFVGIGAYSSAVTTSAFGLDPWIGLLVALALTGLSAYVIGALTLRLEGHYLPLSTIAWGIALYFLFGNIELLGGQTGLGGIPPIRMFTFALDTPRSIFLLIWLVVMFALVLATNLLNSGPGRAMRSLKGGAVMAEMFGIDTATVRVKTFVLAALLAGLSGWLYVHMLRFVNPTPFGLNFGIEYLFMTVVGGAGLVWGALVGAATVIISKELLQDFLPAILGHGGNYEMIVFGVVLIILLQKAPEGFLHPLRKFFTSAEYTAQDTGVTPVDLPIRDKPIPDATVLMVSDLGKKFAGLVALEGLSFSLRAGEIVGVIGPNGAGKSTMFNVVSGVISPTTGSVQFWGRSIERLPSRKIAAEGLARTFQHVLLLPTMSVVENVMIGADHRASTGFLPALLHLERRREKAVRLEASRQLDRVGLAQSALAEAGSLALGQQRIVEIARALSADPTILLLDEPAAGLRLQEKVALAKTLRQLRREGVSILIVEHDMDFVMNLVDRLIVLDFGHLIAEGKPEFIQSDARVLEAYLGGVE
ncbi:branched-chain amino acid ABC transporter ATP-binding protein/permease [Bradyrhizobium sp. NP1]|uniref:branched-chain amino acid ABC transporter ATP-binding protein/permease n=1 Tax=Bradyrhizobium sp. NP1 TaxID=3049772 RepID=UPI0025A6859E|nr:branched-chain amino acid ABC transporter ATP-binding protein/permease [Bradyrhizobium sp. NP1]WJR76758.1 branched-chain amino acid ABC transporter ATP-binding protein/permease [Bradyrhizobium sp. NP1]